MAASRDGTCKGPVVDKTLVRVNPERRKLRVWREGECGLGAGAGGGSPLWLQWGLHLYSKTSEAMKASKKDVTRADLGV